VPCPAAALERALRGRIANAATPGAGLPNRCAVCLGPPLDAAVLDCMHAFCYACISRWIDTSTSSPARPALCPLCKCPVAEMFFNVELAAPSSLPSVPADLVRCVRRRLPKPLPAARVAAVLNSLTPRERILRRIAFTAQLVRQGSRSGHLSDRDVPAPLTVPIPQHFSHDVLVRRAVYARSAYAKPLVSSRRLVNIATVGFSGSIRGDNMDRIKCFLRRDLQALLWRAEVDFELILALNTFARGLSLQDTVDRLLPTIGERTKHFAHESLMFMLSSYDVEVYDRLVTYSGNNG
jgi:Zinc finger, C3HC4 type (RING finger)